MAIDEYGRTLSDRIDLLQRLGGGFTLRPTGIEVFIPAADPSQKGWTWDQKQRKLRAGETYTELISRSIP